MFNCKFDSLRGFAFQLPNSIINCQHISQGCLLMPVANALQLFDANSQKSDIVFSAKRNISAIDVRGSLVAIGEKASPGQLISAILLDLKDPENPKVFNYQKTTISFISISLDGEFICSVGSSAADSQQLNLIEVNNQSDIGTRVYFSKALKKKEGKVKAVKFSNRDPNFFVVQTTTGITFYRIDRKNESVDGVQAKTSKVRIYNSFIFSSDGKSLYGCSQNGDIAQISIKQAKQVRVGPRRRVITKGITNIRYIDPGYLCISGKEGLVALIEESTMKLVKEIKLEDEEVVSLSQFSGSRAYLATNKAAIYDFDANTCDVKVIYSCHSTKINSMAMISNFQGIFGTCSGGQIVVWRSATLSPILKIYLPKVTCLSIFFPKTGRLILSGWSDDSIRIFSPQNGKLIHKVAEAILGKPRVIISDEDSTQMVAGGDNGVIRIWNILQNKAFGLVQGTLAFHMRPVHGLVFHPTRLSILASCSEDGHVAVWNIANFQLLHTFAVANFLQGLTFFSPNVIRTWGAGNKIFDCLMVDGNIARTHEVEGTYVNDLCECFMDDTDERIIFYGGDEPFLDYFQLTNNPKPISRLHAFGQILKIVLSCDNKRLILGTKNGILLSFEIFPAKKIEKDY